MKIEGVTLKKKLELKGNTAQESLNLLKLLGIEFSNEKAVIEMMEKPGRKSDGIYNDISWVTQAVLDAGGNISSLFDLNVGGNLKNLIALQLETSDDIGSMSFRAMDGGKVHAVSLKSFANILADDLNQGGSTLARIMRSPTAKNSVWGHALQQGQKVELVWEL